MSSLKDKLYNYEQTPPANVWDKITAALDESHIADAFPSKLYTAEAAPPASAWDKITSSLDAEHAPAIPMRQKGFPLFRYAAAIVIIGLATFGVIKWAGNNGKTTDEGIATSKEHLSPVNNETALPGEKSTALNNDERENPAIQDNNTHVENTDEAKASRIRKVKNYTITDDIAPAEAIYAYNEHTPNLADRYVMLMTPNGIVRMSKKLGNIVCCVTGEEQDENCKDQIRKWQEKLAASPVAPAPGNFMDILSLLSSLDENDL
ncbi:MAG TPA: hypothetical protein VIZ28_04145 [Chitinophagaceae bacterium]